MAPETSAVGTRDAVGEARSGAARRWMLWAGRVVSALTVLAMAVSAAMKFARPPQVVDMFTGHLGYPAATLTALGVLELACAVVYAIPRTGVLGAALLTAYLGGAVATHVRVGDPFLAPVILGAVAWLGLWLRDERVRALLPLRR